MVFRLFVVAMLASLVGCSSNTVKRYADGDEVQQVTLSEFPTSEQQKSHNKSYQGKYSINQTDYVQMYALSFAEMKEKGAFAPDKPRLPLFEPGSGLVAVNSLGIALNLAGSSWASSLFSNGFLSAGIVLGMLTPKSPEEQFVNLARMHWNAIQTSSVRYLKIQPVSSTASTQEIDTVSERWFEEAHALLKEAGIVCRPDKDGKEKLEPGFRRRMLLRCQAPEEGNLLIFSIMEAPESNYVKKYGPSVVSRWSLIFKTDEQVAAAHAKIRPLMKDGWMALYPGVDAEGKRRMYVEQGKDVAMYDLPPNPFAEQKKAP